MSPHSCLDCLPDQFSVDVTQDGDVEHPGHEQHQDDSRHLPPPRPRHRRQVGQEGHPLLTVLTCRERGFVVRKRIKIPLNRESEGETPREGRHLR